MIIENLSAIKFKINGLTIPKVYRARIVGGDRIQVDNVNNNERLFEPLIYSDITVDQIIYNSALECANALNAIITQESSGSITDENGNVINVQNPLPADGDSVYSKDIKKEWSIVTDWTNADGVVEENNIFVPFNDLHSLIKNETSDNPKSLLIHFNRTINAHQVGIGCFDSNYSFSNIKVILLGSSLVERTVVDTSDDDTKYNSLNIQFEPQLFNAIKLEFHTIDPVGISNLTIQKASIVQSTIQGQTRDGDVKNIGTSDLGNLNVALAEYQGDAFGRLRVSEPYTIADNSLVYDHAVDLFWTNKTSGAGASITYDKATSKQTLSVTNNGEWAASQTKQRFKYQPGKSHELLATGLFQKETGVEKYFGYFDLDNYDAPVIDGNIKNGIAIVVKNNSVYFQLYNNGSLVSEAEQSTWSEDKLDGTGPSGLTLDMVYAQIGFMDMEWLGVGTIRVGFAINGVIINCHKFHHANVSVQDVYMRSANLPVCYLIKSTGGAGSLKQICSSVISEGGFNPKGHVFAINSPSSIPISTGISELVIGFRLKQSGFDATVIPIFVKILNILSASGTIYLCFNPTYGGDAPTWADLDGTNIQIGTPDSSGNTVSDFGIKQYVDYLGQEFFGDGVVGGGIDSSLKIGKDLDGNYDECWLVYEAIANSNVIGTIGLKDLL